MKRALAALLLIPILLLSACSGWAVPETPGGEATPTPPASASQSPAPEAPTQAPVPTPSPAPLEAPAPVWDRDSYAEDFKADDGTLIFHAAMDLPRISNADGVEAYEAVNAYYASAMVQYQADVADRASWARDDYAVSASAGFPFFANTEDSSFEIAYDDGRLVSVRRTLAAVADGAEDAQIFRTADSFDLSTGRRLTFSDCFADPDTARTRVKDTILSTGAQGITAVSLDVAFAPEHFYLTDQGMVFWYQQGDLEGLAAPLEFTVPYQQLEGLFVSWINH